MFLQRFDSGSVVVIQLFLQGGRQDLKDSGQDLPAPVILSVNFIPSEIIYFFIGLRWDRRVADGVPLVSSCFSFTHIPATFH